MVQTPVLGCHKCFAVQRVVARALRGLSNRLRTAERRNAVRQRAKVDGPGVFKAVAQPMRQFLCIPQNRETARAPHVSRPAAALPFPVADLLVLGRAVPKVITVLSACPDDGERRAEHSLNRVDALPSAFVHVDTDELQGRWQHAHEPTPPSMIEDVAKGRGVLLPPLAQWTLSGVRKHEMGPATMQVLERLVSGF